MVAVVLAVTPLAESSNVYVPGGAAGPTGRPGNTAAGSTVGAGYRISQTYVLLPARAIGRCGPLPRGVPSGSNVTVRMRPAPGPVPSLVILSVTGAVGLSFR